MLTAATLNTIGAAWVTYTPAPIQGNFLTGFTTNYSKYALFQKTCIVTQKITFTSSAGAVAAYPIVTNLPFAAAAGLSGTGSYHYFDSGVQNYVGTAKGTAFNSSYVEFIVNAAGQLGINPAFLAAVNDTLQISYSYEVA